MRAIYAALLLCSCVALAQGASKRCNVLSIVTNVGSWTPTTGPAKYVGKSLTGFSASQARRFRTHSSKPPPLRVPLAIHIQGVPKPTGYCKSLGVFPRRGPPTASLLFARV